MPLEIPLYGMLCPAQLLRCHFAADAWQLQHTQLRVGSGMSATVRCCLLPPCCLPISMSILTTPRPDTHTLTHTRTHLQFSHVARQDSCPVFMPHACAVALIVLRCTNTKLFPVCTLFPDAALHAISYYCADMPPCCVLSHLPHLMVACKHEQTSNAGNSSWDGRR